MIRCWKAIPHKTCRHLSSLRNSSILVPHTYLFCRAFWDDTKDHSMLMCITWCNVGCEWFGVIKNHRICIYTHCVTTTQMNPGNHEALLILISMVFIITWNSLLLQEARLQVLEAERDACGDRRLIRVNQGPQHKYIHRNCQGDMKTRRNVHLPYSSCNSEGVAECLRRGDFKC